MTSEVTSAYIARMECLSRGADLPDVSDPMVTEVLVSMMNLTVCPLTHLAAIGVGARLSGQTIKAYIVKIPILYYE